MGFFSQDCKGCGHPVLSSYVTNRTNRWMQQAVAITPNGSVLRGFYDGYGSLCEHDGAVGFDNTVWHLACWEVAGEPTTYTGPSEPSDDQGYFFADPEHDMADPRTSVP
jgi:hypothetical protein